MDWVKFISHSLALLLILAIVNMFRASVEQLLPRLRHLVMVVLALYRCFHRRIVRHGGLARQHERAVVRPTAEVPVALQLAVVLPVRGRAVGLKRTSRLHTYKLHQAAVRSPRRTRERERTVPRIHSPT